MTQVPHEHGGEEFPREHGVEIVFKELNEHLRNTELKSLQLTLGYMALVSIALSILAAHSGSLYLTRYSTGKLLAFGALAAVGCLVSRVQVLYAGWKKDYLEHIRQYGGLYRLGEIPGLTVPYLLKPPDPERGSADRTLRTFSTFTAVAATVLFAMQCVALADRTWLDVVAVLAVVFLFIVVLGDDAARDLHETLNSEARRRAHD